MKSAPSCAPAVRSSSSVGRIPLSSGSRCPGWGLDPGPVPDARRAGLIHPVVQGPHLLPELVVLPDQLVDRLGVLLVPLHELLDCPGDLGRVRPEGADGGPEDL